MAVLRGSTGVPMATAALRSIKHQVTPTQLWPRDGHGGERVREAESKRRSVSAGRSPRARRYIPSGMRTALVGFTLACTIPRSCKWPRARAREWRTYLTWTRSSLEWCA